MSEELPFTFAADFDAIIANDPAEFHKFALCFENDIGRRLRALPSNDGVRQRVCAWFIALVEAAAVGSLPTGSEEAFTGGHGKGAEGHRSEARA
jgi:hypothetical protein